MFSTSEVLDRLGYSESRTFFSGDRLSEIPAFAHVFRLASRDCGLKGVYALHRHWDELDKSIVPVVFVCEAADRVQADRIHRLVWNQNVAPFVIVRTPEDLRLYSGFSYRDDGSASTNLKTSRVLRDSVSVMDFASRVLPSFRSESIDNGTIWKREGRYVRPEARVDWRLLGNLEKLDEKLRIDMYLPSHSAHALIGKYVYLRYLYDRNILSPEKLAKFRVSKKRVFSRDATIREVKKLISKLDEWLNGSIFDIPWGDGIETEHLRLVAATFFGDEPGSGQLSLFEDYNFAHIPVETLSVVYEQFLHAEGRGKKVGAYYTPIPLIDFVLDTVEQIHPLKPGMRVLDPACGSGAFLVQAYRRLIEKQRALKNNEKLLPTELRDLLCKHFFGVDRDEDACQVAELSLILTLLDYIDPPDLSQTTFKLPVLNERNVWGGKEEDFFNTKSNFHIMNEGKSFDWVVGNPPWTEISVTRVNGKKKVGPEFKHAYSWMLDYQIEFPTGGNQVAELFCWKVTQHCERQNGIVALLVPAMTLFKQESERFRSEFFKRCRVESVANLANLAYVLFAGRRLKQYPQRPCAAFFFRCNLNGQIEQEDRILTYAPFVINQEVDRPMAGTRSADTWSIVVNGSEMREVAVADAATGNRLVWKVAMWGSHRDRNLLAAIALRFPSLQKLEESLELRISQGLELRELNKGEAVDAIPEVAGENQFLAKKLSGKRRYFTVPPFSLSEIPPERAFCRKGRSALPLMVCAPPHILVSASRNYAIYSDEFFVIPPRQVGIASAGQSDFLKALSLYLVSDFAVYHQFFWSPQWGIDTNISNLDTLRMLPVPFSENPDVIDKLVRIHTSITSLELQAEATVVRRGRCGSHSHEDYLFGPSSPESSEELLREMNDIINSALGLKNDETMLVDDLVNLRLLSNKGKVSEECARPPMQGEIKQYADVLVEELDGFLEGTSDNRHQVKVFVDAASGSALVEIFLDRSLRKSPSPQVFNSPKGFSQPIRELRAHIRSTKGQWLYFDRNLRLYDNVSNRMYLLKPLQRLHWLRSQALMDADLVLNDLVR